jgi:hypothetical protein
MASETSNSERSLALCVALGLSLGAGIGVVLGAAVGAVVDSIRMSLALGPAIGSAIGLAVGMVLCYHSPRISTRVAHARGMLVSPNVSDMNTLLGSGR